MARVKKIYWFQVPSSKRYGGRIYSEKAIKVLSEEFDLEIVNIKAKYFKNRYLKFFECYFKALTLKKLNGLLIIDNSCSIIPFNLTKKIKGKSVALVHHIDSSAAPAILKPVLFILEKVFLKNLRKTNIIIVVSEYWRNNFLKKGYPKVFKIYNSIDLPNQISKQEISEFKKRFGIEGKPIIYIGNCQKAKGVVESYQALKGLDVYLVSSGEQKVKTPAINLNLDYRDYLCFLKACSVVLTMSKFKEGWCRTAHEAMLSKTPVIGSGMGGMRELLEGGKQIISEDFGSLAEKVEYLLNHPEIREKMGEDGYNFAKEFNFKKFKKEWIKLISKF